MLLVSVDYHTIWSSCCIQPNYLSLWTLVIAARLVEPNQLTRTTPTESTSFPRCSSCSLSLSLRRPAPRCGGCARLLLDRDVNPPQLSRASSTSLLDRRGVGDPSESGVISSAAGKQALTCLDWLFESILGNLFLSERLKSTYLVMG
jgi:hypothetical protein